MPVDANSASQRALTALEGIGDELAGRIIQGRPFDSTEDLLSVPGIGRKSLARITEQGLVVSSAEASSRAVADTVSVFISRKEEDRALAEKVKEKLSLYGGGRIQFYMSSDIPAAADWAAWIRDRLADADLMILLFTDPTATWDWCLYESGLFTPLSGEAGGRVICFHNADAEPPAPLQRFQAVRAEEGEMTDFLRQFFGTDEVAPIRTPLNRPFAENNEELAAVATFLCELFQSETNESDVYFHNRNLSLTVVDPGRLQPDHIPVDTMVVADRASLEIFGLQERPPDRDTWTWGSLEEKMSTQRDTTWIKELAQSIEWACQGAILKPIDATFTSFNGDKTYRANVNRRERHADGSMTLQVLLIHQSSEPSGAP